MKISAIILLLGAMLVAVYGSPFHNPPTLSRPNPGSAGFPNFPGYGSFNPRGWGRHRRSPDGGKVTVDQPVDGKATVTVDADHKVYQGEHGSVSVYGHGDMKTGGHPNGQAGVRAEIHWDD